MGGQCFNGRGQSRDGGIPPVPLSLGKTLAEMLLLPLQQRQDNDAYWSFL